MPLNIRVDDITPYEAALLPVSETIEDTIAGLPGLVGAWDAVDWAAGDWMPRMGPGRIVLTAVTAGAREGRAVMQFAPGSVGSVRDAANADIVPAELVYASRAYFSDVSRSWQKIADMTTPELFVRHTLSTPVWQFKDAAAASVTSALAGGAVARWRTFTFSKSATDAPELEADGAAPAAVGAAGAALGAASLALGDTNGGNGAVQDVARLIICTTGALTDTQRAAINQWLAG